MELSDILAELKRRAAPQLIMAALQPHQLMLAKATTRRRAVIASRRAGKSVACSLLAHAMCQGEAKRVLWLSITLTNIRRIAEDAMRIAVASGGEVPVLNRSRWVYEYPTSSQIEIAGCDQTLDAAERYTGAGYDLVIIDEAGSIDPDQLDYLIDSVLWPALMDRQGLLVLVGTPRRNVAGRFWEVTSDPTGHPDWTVLRWRTDQNASVKAQWEAEVASLTPEQLKAAHVRREIFGEWIDEVGNTAYQWQNIKMEPKAPDGEWRYVLGIDFGFSSANGFVLLGWRKHDTTLRIFKAWSKGGLLTSQIAGEIKMVLDVHKGCRLVGDPAAAQTIADLSQLYGCHIIGADKHDIDGVIEAINDDASAGRLNALTEAQPLLDEMADLDLVKKGNKLVPNPLKPDHMCDAFRYAWRACGHRMERPAPVPLPEGDRILADMRKKAAEADRIRRRRGV
jgi:hypothetical protein